MRFSLLISVVFILISCKNNSSLNDGEETVISSYKITKHNPEAGEFPGGRDINDMIIYTSEYGDRTGTNPWGIEVIIEKDYVKSLGSNNSEIPKDGFVLSGHGVSSRWITSNIKPGLKVIEDKDSVYLIKTLKSDLIYAKSILEKAKGRGADVNTNLSQIQILIEGKNLSSESVSEILQKSKIALYSTYNVIENEVRANWFRPTDSNPEEADATIKEMAELGFNLICPETIYGGYSIYPSEIEGLEQNPNFKGWDPLKVYLEAGKKYGIEVVPWVWCYFVGREDSPLVSSKKDWLAKSRKGVYPSEIEIGYHFFCPSEKQVNRFWLDVYSDLLSRYDLEGLQLDYIRYAVSSPYEVGYCYCERCQKIMWEKENIDILKITPGDSVKWQIWDEYRIANITEFVGQVRSLIDKTSPTTRLAADVFPDEESSLKSKKQDWGDWLRKGFLDDVYIMSYTTDVEIVGAQTTYMMERVGEGQRGITGLGPYIGIAPETLLDQIEIARLKGASGVTLFSYGSLNEEQKLALKTGPFR